MQIETIPLSRLVPSPANVRKAKTDITGLAASIMARGSQRGMRAPCPAACPAGGAGGFVPNGEVCCPSCPVSSVDATVQVSPTPPTVRRRPATYAAAGRRFRAIFTGSPMEHSSPCTPCAIRPWPPSRRPGPRARSVRRAPSSRGRARRCRRTPNRSVPPSARKTTGSNTPRRVVGSGTSTRCSREGPGSRAGAGPDRR